MDPMEKKAKSGPSYLSILLNGLIKENPVMVLLLGTCPSLAVTTMASNAIGHGPRHHLRPHRLQRGDFPDQKHHPQNLCASPAILW